MTATGALVGSVAYLAPEVIRGEAATPASDRYAFAALGLRVPDRQRRVPAHEQRVGALRPRQRPAAARSALRRPELGRRARRRARAGARQGPGRAARFRPRARRVAAPRAGPRRRGGPPRAPAPGPRRARSGTTTTAAAAPPSPRPRRDRGAAPRCGPSSRQPSPGRRRWPGPGPCSRTTTRRPTRPAVADRPGLAYVGADLDGGSARTLDCRGRAPSPDSPTCTVLQADMPGATLVVPQDGVIRHWAVRGARGEMTLTVLRPRRGSGASRSRSPSTETVGSAETQSFDAEVEVERGDRVGLLLAPGSAVGTRDGAEGATLARWLPPVGGLEQPGARDAAGSRERAAPARRHRAWRPPQRAGADHRIAS